MMTDFVRIFSSIPKKRTFCERVEARGFTRNFASKYIKHTIEGIERADPLNSPVELNHPYDSNNIIAVTMVRYQGRGTVLKQLSVEATRNTQRLGPNPKFAYYLHRIFLLKCDLKSQLNLLGFNKLQAIIRVLLFMAKTYH